MLSYAFRVAMQLINNRTYRKDLLRTLIDLYKDLEKPDYVQMCQCLIFLDDPLSVASVLETLSQVSHLNVIFFKPFIHAHLSNRERNETLSWDIKLLLICMNQPLNNFLPTWSWPSVKQLPCQR